MGKGDLAVMDLSEDGLRARYLPEKPGLFWSWDDFVQRGADLLQLGRACYLVLGELVDLRLQTERCETDESKRALIERAAREWQISPSRLWRAWVTACAHPEVERPQDATPTLTYEVLSSTDDPEEVEERLDFVLREGLKVEDVRNLKRLEAQGVIEEWKNYRLFSNGDGEIWVSDGMQAARVALLEGGSELTEVGIKLLRYRARV